MNLTEVIKRPLLTEKTNGLKADSNQVVFEVAMKADKTLIKRAVEELFSVGVTCVNTTIMHGIVITVGRSRGRLSNWKKAVVSLKEGANLEFFEGV